jgi:hypothetical protein
MCIISVHTPKCKSLYLCVEQHQYYALLAWHTSHCFMLLHQISPIMQICWYALQAQCPRYEVNFLWLTLTVFMHDGCVFCTWLKTKFVLGFTEFLMFLLRKWWHCIIVHAHERWKVWRSYDTCVRSSEWNVADSHSCREAWGFKRLHGDTLENKIIFIFEFTYS